jgi:hypothetical protein
MNRRFMSMLFLGVSSLLWAAGASLTAQPVVYGRVIAPIARLMTGFPQQSSAPQAGGANFVGDDTCTACHETEGKTLLGSLHGKSANPRAPAAKPTRPVKRVTARAGARRVGDKTKIRVFPAMAPHDASAVCLTCHNRSNHAGWEGARTKRGISAAPRATACTTRSRSNGSS